MRLYSVAIIIWAANVIATTDVSIEDSGSNRDFVEYNNKHEEDDDAKDDCEKNVTLNIEDTRQQDDVGENDNKSESSTARSQRRLNQIIQPYMMKQAIITSDEQEAENRSPLYGHYNDAKLGRRTGKTFDDPSFDEVNEDIVVDDVQYFGQRIRPPTLSSIKNKSHRNVEYFEDKANDGTTSSRAEEVELNSEAKKLNAAHQETVKDHRGFTFTGPEKNTLNGTSNGLLTTLISLKDLKQLLNIPTGFENPQAVNGTKKVLMLSDSAHNVNKHSNPINTGNRHQEAEEVLRQARGKVLKSEKLEKSEDIGVTSTSSNLESLEVEDGFNDTLSRGKLFRPIVVPEFVQIKKSAHTTATPFHSETENQDSTLSYPTVTTLTESNVIQTADTKPNTSCHDHITSLSMILNPLQVGIALMNAADAHLINNAGDTPATEELLEQASDTETKTQSNNNNQLVETQKSIEIYHNAPVQEIHYPIELVPNIKQNHDLYRNQETDNILNSQRNQIFQNPLPSGQLNEINGYKGTGEKNFKQSTQSTYHQGDQARQIYNYHENSGNNNIAAPQLTTFQQYSSILLPLDGQNYISSTERNTLGNHLPRDQYEDALYGQSSILQHAIDATSQGKLATNAIRQDTLRQNVKPYGAKLEEAKLPHHADSQQSQLIGASKILEYQSHSLLDPILQLGFFNSKKQSPNQPHPVDAAYQNSQINQNNNVPTNEPKYLPIGALQYSVGKTMEKTVHVPVPVEIEKVIERRIPYAMEKIIEKHVRVPEPYAVYVQFPVDRVVEKQVRVPQPYPVHIEKVIEKKVPYTVQRLVVQPYPVHIKVPQPYLVEKPVHVPVSIEKVIEKKLHVPHPIPIEVEKNIDRPRLYPVDVTRLVVNPPLSAPVHNDAPYNPANYQQYNRDQNAYLKSALSYYGVSRMDTQNPHNGSQYTYVYHKLRSDDDVRAGMNGNKEFGPSYVGYHSLRQNSGGPKKFAPRGSTYSRFPYALFGDTTVPHKRLAIFPLKDMEKPIKDSASGASRQIQSTSSLSTKMSELSVVGPTQSTTSTATANRIRQAPGTFRQSKMEYGFKPPMVPSIQYDEKTASKVDN